MILMVKHPMFVNISTVIYLLFFISMILNELFIFPILCMECIEKLFIVFSHLIVHCHSRPDAIVKHVDDWQLYSIYRSYRSIVRDTHI